MLIDAIVAGAGSWGCTVARWSAGVHGVQGAGEVAVIGGNVRYETDGAHSS